VINNNNNNKISIAPYGHNFRGTGCGVGSVFGKCLIKEKILKSRFRSHH